jgi:hypothetical protein
MSAGFGIFVKRRKKILDARYWILDARCSLVT